MSVYVKIGVNGVTGAGNPHKIKVFVLHHLKIKRCNRKNGVTHGRLGRMGKKH